MCRYAILTGLVALLLTSVSLVKASGPSQQEGWADETAILDVFVSLKENEVVSGEYTEERDLAIFTKPLVVSGHFLAVKGKGVVWDTGVPVSAKIVIKPGSLKLYADDTVKELRTSGMGSEAMSLLLPALFNGDIHTLKSYFRLSAQQQGKRWALKLVPEEGSPLLKIFQWVIVKGESNRIHQAQMLGYSGDNTSISFHHVVANSRPTHVQQLEWFL